MMTHNLFLSAIAVPILTMGIGCTTQNISDEIQSTYSDNSYTTYATTESDSSDTSTISLVIEPGVQTVQIDHGPPIITTVNYGIAHSVYEKNGMRFGFTDCVGSLKSLTTKPDFTFMIDNRDNKSHNIGIDSKIHTFAPYDFALVRINKLGNFPITCNGAEVAYVRIQD